LDLHSFPTRRSSDLAGGLVALEFQTVERGLGSLQQRDATACDDALLDRGLRVAHRVLDAVLALLQLDLGGGTRLDDGHATGQLGDRKSTRLNSSHVK